MSKFCPECGSEVIEGTEKCHNCGFALKITDKESEQFLGQSSSYISLSKFFNYGSVGLLLIAIVFFSVTYYLLNDWSSDNAIAQVENYKSIFNIVSILIGFGIFFVAIMHFCEIDKIADIKFANLMFTTNLDGNSFLKTHYKKFASKDTPKNDLYRFALIMRATYISHNLEYQSKVIIAVIIKAIWVLVGWSLIGIALIINVDRYMKNILLDIDISIKTFNYYVAIMGVLILVAELIYWKCFEKQYFTRIEKWVEENSIC